MKKIIIPLILGVIVSLYFFPIGLTFLPSSINTKMLLGVAGIGFFAFECIRNKSVHFSKEIFWSALIALAFSLSCYYSVVSNNTDDTSYAGYFMSYAVWLGGAYAVIMTLKLYHGSVTIDVLARYLLWVGVGQCISVLLIDNIPAFSDFVDRFMEIGQAHVREMNRLYGIGSALDPAGVRFSVILVLTAHYVCTYVIKNGTAVNLAICIIAFLFIVMVGNMVSRTTTVGALLGLGYLALYLVRVEKGVMHASTLKALVTVGVVVAVAVPVVTILYNTNENMHDNLRFAFEGFFNWVEQGEWRTDSTDKLNTVMWVWPEDTRTWIIGSGLFNGFIYSTDIGYCRFILYCGLLGFSLFCALFIYCSYTVLDRFENSWLLALLLLALVFAIWVKVATDIFLIFALLMCTDPDGEEEDEDDEEEEAVVETMETESA